MSCGIHEELLITERAASHVPFSLGHHEHIWLTVFLLSNSNKSDPLIAVESNSYSDLAFKLVDFDDTLDTFNDRCKDSMLHHRHAEFNKHNDFDEISTFLHVEFIRYSEVQNALGGYLSACDIDFIDSLVNLEA